MLHNQPSGSHLPYKIFGSDPDSAFRLIVTFGPEQSDDVSVPSDSLQG